MAKIKLILARHGEARLDGSGSLSERGVEQARNLAYALRDRDIAACHSSNALRAVETAGIVLRDRPVEIIREVSLREFGSITGFAGGETEKQFIDRIKRFLDKINENYKGGEVLVMTHTDVISEMAVMAGRRFVHVDKGSFVELDYNPLK